MKNEVHLDFTIADFGDITHDEVTQKLGISPKKIYVKGKKNTLIPLLQLWLKETVGSWDLL